MKRVRRKKALSILMTVCMLVGLLPLNVLGNAVEVQAAESSAADYVTYSVGEWTASSDGAMETRTTTWDFATNSPDAGIKITVGDTLKGIASAAGTVQYKSGGQGLSLGGSASVMVPLDTATTSVVLEFQLTSNNSSRWLKIGNDQKSVTVSQNTSADGERIDNTRKYTSAEYTSEYFTSNAIQITSGTSKDGDSGESKISYIKITETRAKSGDSDNSGDNTGDDDTEYVDFSDTYDFRDGSVVPTDTAGNVSVTSANGKLTVAPGSSNAYGYNGAQHGVQFKAGNTITIKVKKGTGTVQVGDCQYSKTDSIDVSLGGATIGTLSPATTGCYHQDTEKNVMSVNYDCTADEADLVLEFNNSVYVPVIIVTGKEPKPAVTEVTATVTVNDNGLLGETDTVTLVKDGAEPIDITGANAKDVTLDVNSTYNIVCSNADVKATADGKTTVTTTVEALTVTVDVVSTVVNPVVTITDAGSVLGDAVLTLTNSADETEVYTLTAGAAVKLKIGATYKLTCSSDAVSVKINDSAFLKVTDDLSTINVVVEPLDMSHHTYDVWDFGAEQLESTSSITYNNKLTEDIINAWYPGVEAGTKGPTIPGDLVAYDEAGNEEFRFNAGGKTNNRYRTTNTKLTRYDEKSLKNIEDSSIVYSGYLYSNSGKTDAVNVQLAVKAGDIVTFVVSSNGTASDITWRSPSGNEDVKTYSGTSSQAQEMTFYAAEDGMYTLYSATEKLVVARIYRERPATVTVSGSVNAPEGADLSEAKLVFTNTVTGVQTEAYVTDGAYSVQLSEQYGYTVSLEGANGYIVDENDFFELANEAGNTVFNVNIIGVETISISGSLADLDAESAAKLVLEFKSDNVFVPDYKIDAENMTYTATVEKGVTYQVTASGVNDYVLETTTVSVSAEGSTVALKFTKKPTYAVNVTLDGVAADKASGVKLTFTNINEEGYVYTFTGTQGIELRDGQYKVSAVLDGYTQKVTSDVKVNGADVDKTITMKSDSESSKPVAYKEVVTVGTNGDYATINEALEAVRSMERSADQRVTISIEPGNYEEMLVIDVDNITLKNAAATPSIELTDKGVNIAEGAVRITSYYGHGYTYYSMGSDCKYDAELLEVNKENGYPSFVNPGSGTTSGSYWNATVVVNADGFVADGIIFENSFNQYVSAKAAQDIIVKQSSAKEGTTPRADMKEGDVTVQNKAYVERAAALAIYNNKSDIVFNNCKFVGRQDTLYGGTGVYAEFNQCSVYGGTDYIFGGMTAIFNKCNLVFNTSEDKNDVGYITAAQQKSGRGYLMYKCHITSTTPGVDTASAYTSKPGYFGRPWAANTSEVVFFETTIDEADAYWGGGSLITAAGWNNSLSGESAGMYEYGTVEKSGVDNLGSRAAWATKLTETVLNDGTKITLEAFRKAVVVEDYYVIDISGGLKKGVTYDGGISVIEDMAYKAVEAGDTISGTKYYGYVAGSNNPKIGQDNPVGTVPDSGSVLKLTAEKDGKLKLAVKINAGKTVYFVDEQGNSYDEHKNSGSSSEFVLLSYDVEAGHTYYFYGNGTKVPMYSIVVDYRAPEAWDNIAVPVLGTPVVDNKTGIITVPFTAMVGGIYADSLEIRMLNEAGDIVDTISYATESEEGSVEFEPNESGSYTFVAILRRSGVLGKTSNQTEAVAFVLPMKAPTIIGVENQGSGAVKFSWKEVSEAESYKVYLNGEYKETVTKPYARFEGLTVGEEYTFGVEAVRGEDISAMAETKQTITGEAQKSWYYAAFGSGADTKNNGFSGNVDASDLCLWSLNTKGKLVPASTDGLAFYYTTIDPDTENFTLSADVEVVNWTLTNGQEGFGLMAADAVGEDGDSSVFWNNSYMASVTKVEYNWDKSSQTVSDSGDKYTMKLGVGSQEKIGVTNENIADETTVNYFSSKMTTLETSCAESGFGAGTHNIVGNYTNTNTDDMGNVDNLITTFHLTIQRNNTGYFISYTDQNGKTVTNKYYHGDDGDELTKIDENNIYVGFFASRSAKINVKNVELTTIKPEDDAEAEERPITYVTPNYSIESAKNANASDYDLVYVGNAAGTLTIKNDKGEVLKTSDGKYNVENLEVDANTKVHVSAVLAAGENTFAITFTPNADYQPSKYEKLSSYKTVNFNFTVTYKASSLENIYVSPSGKSNGLGTKESPLDIYTAVKYAQPGQKILLMEGTYKLSSTITIERGINGTQEQPIYMMADPEAATRPVLDFSRRCAGMIMAGNYWYFKGFDVTNTANAQKGIQVSGSYNTLDSIYAYRNGNTGIQISRYKSTDEWEDWPSNNLILNCTSYLNADAGYEDADGFAAKLTIGNGNVFDGCIAAYNADDGWDLFAKVESGPIGQVVIRNCVAFKNGYVIDADGNEVNAGNGNGFKMGGSSITGKHYLENSISFGNKAKGIDSNSCPDIIVKNSTSFNNESYNVALYTNDAKNTDFSADGIISYKNSNTVAEQFKLLGTQDESKVYGTTNYYFNGKVSKNTAGTVVSESWFESLDMDAAIHGGITRNADGTINTNGFMTLTSAAPSDAGARLSGTASGDVKVTEDNIVTELKAVAETALDELAEISAGLSLDEKINAVAKVLAAFDFVNVTDSSKVTAEELEKLAKLDDRIAALLGTSMTVDNATGVSGISVKNALISVPAGRDGIIKVSSTTVPSSLSDSKIKNAVAMNFGLYCNSNKLSLSVPVVVSMKAPEGIDLNKKIVVYHFADGADTYEKLSVTVDKNTGIIEFVTASYSTFVIANEADTTTEPGTTEPGTTEPGTTEPGTTEPGTTEPGTTEPGTTEPGTTEPGTTEPETTAPSNEEPESSASALSPNTGFNGSAGSNGGAGNGTVNNGGINSTSNAARTSSMAMVYAILAVFIVLLLAGGTFFYVKHEKDRKNNK